MTYNKINIHNIKKNTFSDRACEGLNKIPLLSEELEFFGCFDNYIEKIENLPKNLLIFDCPYNDIKKIENMPDSLQEFYCENNFIKKINNLPFNLKILCCLNNPIAKIINLPNSLTKFSLNSGLIKSHEPNPNKNTFSLKKIIFNYIYKNKLSIPIETIPLDLIDEIKCFNKKCFNCHEIRPIYKKISGIHKKWNIFCGYLYCWDCRNQINNNNNFIEYKDTSL